MGWNRSSESGGANTPGSPHVGQPKFALRSKGDGTARGKSPRPRWLRGAVAAVIVVVGAVSVWWLLSPSPERQTSNAKHQTSKPSRIANAQPAPVQNVKSDNAPTSSASETPAKDDEKWDDSFERIPEKRHKFSTLATVTTSSCGVINERWRMPNGKYWRRQVDPPPIFDNASDNAIAMVLGQRAGTPMPHYPGLDDVDLNEEFVKSLLSPIKINEDDKPWLVALKMSVKEARSEIARMIKEGDPRSVGEILRDHVEENNRQADLTADALKGYNQVLGEDGEAAAAEYLEKVNKALEGYGVAPIKARGTASGRKRK